VLSTKLSTVELVHQTYDGRRVVAVYYLSVDRNPLTSAPLKLRPYGAIQICLLLLLLLTPLLRFVAYIYSTVVLPAVDKITTDIARRAVRLR